MCVRVYVSSLYSHHFPLSSHYYPDCMYMHISYVYIENYREIPHRSGIGVLAPPLNNLQGAVKPWVMKSSAPGGFLRLQIPNSVDRGSLHSNSGLWITNIHSIPQPMNNTSSSWVAPTGFPFFARNMDADTIITPITASTCPPDSLYLPILCHSITHLVSYIPWNPIKSPFLLVDPIISH